MTARTAQVESCGEERILVVDDNQVTLALLSSILRKAGYTAEVAHDGEEALAKVAESPPDLILLDIEMPRLNGFEVLAALTADPLTSTLPVLFITARTRSADKVRGLELGAVDYVTKPFSRAEVLARVQTQLRINQLTRSLVRKQARLDEDLCAAADIQKSLIQCSDAVPEGVRIATRFEPCESIGGDIFNSVRLGRDHLGLYVLDVSGHGVPSAMVPVSVARSLSLEGGLVCSTDASSGETRIAPPSRVLDLLEHEYPMERFGKYFTISYLVLDLCSGKLLYSSAAHPPPVVVRRGGLGLRLREGGSLLGLGMSIPFEQGQLDLSPGDRLFLFTDGIVEHPDDCGCPFGDEQLERLLVGTHERSLEATCDGVMTAIRRHGGGRPPRDDISLFAIEYRGPATRRAAA